MAQYKGILIHKPDSIDIEELTPHIDETIDLWCKNHPSKELGSIEITVEERDYLSIKANEKSPIKRVRRITGYLSTLDSFNDAKKTEERDRVKHI